MIPPNALKEQYFPAQMPSKSILVVKPHWIYSIWLEKKLEYVIFRFLWLFFRCFPMMWYHFTKGKNNQSPHPTTVWKRQSRRPLDGHGTCWDSGTMGAHPRGATGSMASSRWDRGDQLPWFSCGREKRIKLRGFIGKAQNSRVFFLKTWTFNVTTFVFVGFACFSKSILGRQGLVLLASQWMASSITHGKMIFSLTIATNTCDFLRSKNHTTLWDGCFLKWWYIPPFHTPHSQKPSFFSRKNQSQPYGPVGETNPPC